MGVGRYRLFRRLTFPQPQQVKWTHFLARVAPPPTCTPSNSMLVLVEVHLALITLSMYLSTPGREKTNHVLLHKAQSLSSSVRLFVCRACAQLYSC